MVVDWQRPFSELNFPVFETKETRELYRSMNRWKQQFKWAEDLRQQFKSVDWLFRPSHKVGSSYVQPPERQVWAPDTDPNQTEAFRRACRTRLRNFNFEALLANPSDGRNHRKDILQCLLLQEYCQLRRDQYETGGHSGQDLQVLAWDRAWKKYVAYCQRRYGPKSQVKPKNPPKRSRYLRSVGLPGFPRGRPPKPY